MGHQPDDVAALAGDRRDVAGGAVRVVPGRIPEHDTPPSFELIELIVRSEITTGLMLDRNRQPLAGFALPSEWGLGALHDQLHLAADEAERFVRQQRPGKQAGFAEDLEPVADPEHGPSGLGVFRHGLHRRREAGDRARTQVVTVRKPARDDHDVDPLERGVRVPDQPRVPEAPARQHRVAVVARAWELDHAESHAPSSSIS